MELASLYNLHPLISPEDKGGIDHEVTKIRGENNIFPNDDYNNNNNWTTRFLCDFEGWNKFPSGTT